MDIPNPGPYEDGGLDKPGCGDGILIRNLCINQIKIIETFRINGGKSENLKSKFKILINLSILCMKC